MTMVTITETYDLKTTKNSIGIIGIHTPTNALINQLYPGLAKNHKFMRLISCDVVGACASVLPADPLEVGVTEGDIAPEDMFNPILYKAVSNEGFETVVNRIYGAAMVGSLGSVDATTFTSVGPQSQAPNAFDVYYGLLSSREWRHAMPQQGFRISKLVPIAHQLLSAYGQTVAPTDQTVLKEDGESPYSVPNVTEVAVTNSIFTGWNTPKDGKDVVFRGQSVRMPRIPLHYGIENLGDAPNFVIPKTFVAAIITPPARLNEFYYRMRVTWTVRFEEVISSLFTQNASGFKTAAGVSYYKGYSFESAKGLDNECDSVDTNDAISIHKIMEA